MSDRPIIIFGTNGLASLAAHCLIHDSRRTVAAFTVDGDFAQAEVHDGFPVVPFASLSERFPPASHDLLVPLGNRHMNAFREERCRQAAAMGYRLANYVSSHARVWPDTPIGSNVLIYENCIVQSFVKLGDNVILRAGANIGHHSVIGDNTFVASGVVTGGAVTIGSNCFIGLGAILRDGVRIADRCFVGAGAVVIADTEPDSVYVGNPAKKTAKTSLEVTSHG